MIIYIYLLISFVLNILCKYSSSKKLLDSNLESSTRVSRVTRHRRINRPTNCTGWRDICQHSPCCTCCMVHHCFAAP